MSLATIEDLRAHIALARRVELSTIPPYLYAMYSIRDQESEAARLIASVVVEEMLHLGLTTNLLLALGGEPDFDAGLIPSYPSLLSHHKPDLMLELRRCTPELIRDTFMVIELPRATEAPSEEDQYETLGQFYAALEDAVDELGATTDLFSNHQPERQISDPSVYAAVAWDDDDSGGFLLIDDTGSARQAMEIIIHQGEGVSEERWADASHREMTHYHKFARLADGTTSIGGTHPVTTNPRIRDLPEEVRPVARLFNALYTIVFETMRRLFSDATDKSAAVGDLYSLMSAAMAPVAQLLVTLPIGPHATAGPTFEQHTFGPKPRTETLELASEVAATHPELSPVVGVIREL